MPGSQDDAQADPGGLPSGRILNDIIGKFLLLSVLRVFLKCSHVVSLVLNESRLF